MDGCCSIGGLFSYILSRSSHVRVSVVARPNFDVVKENVRPSPLFPLFSDRKCVPYGRVPGLSRAYTTDGSMNV